VQVLLYSGSDHSDDYQQSLALKVAKKTGNTDYDAIIRRIEHG